MRTANFDLVMDEAKASEVESTFGDDARTRDILETVDVVRRMDPSELQAVACEPARGATRFPVRLLTNGIGQSPAGVWSEDRRPLGEASSGGGRTPMPLDRLAVALGLERRTDPPADAPRDPNRQDLDAFGRGRRIEHGLAAMRDEMGRQG